MALTDFQVNTDAPLDKVILAEQVTVTAPNNTYAEFTIPNPFPFAPLAFGNWSLSSDFQTTYEYSTGPPSYSSQSAFTLSAEIAAFSDSIKIYVPNFYLGSSATLYCRVFAFQPSNIPPLDIAHTNIGADDFMINTDQSQVQLIDNNYHDFPGVPALTTYTQTLFTHDLGYSPQVMMWVERDGRIEVKQTTAPSFGSVDIVTNATDVSIRVAGPSIAGRMHYRVYANE